MYLFVYMFVYMSVYVFVYLFVYMFVYSLVYLFVYFFCVLVECLSDYGQCANALADHNIRVYYTPVICQSLITPNSVCIFAHSSFLSPPTICP